MGPGMWGGGNSGMGPGMMGGWVQVPERLPKPKSREWLNRLAEILASEKQSLAQYQADQVKFNVTMPYMMVIPQEVNHVQTIGRLFAAYGLPAAQVEKAPVIVSNTLEDAFREGVRMERELLTHYQWLIENSGDPDSTQILDTIQLQSRWHLAMFEHAASGWGRRGRRGF